jgi:hypothetical protein
MRLSKAVLTAILASLALPLLFSCEKLAGSNASQSETVASVTVANTWDEHAVHLLATHRCEDLRALLKSVPDAKVDERWFRLRVLGEAMCWTHSRSARDKQSALQAADQGIARYPTSAGLLAAKGGLMQLFGDAAGARGYYNQARQTAEANLRANPNSREDRSVLTDLTGRLPPGDLTQRVPAGGVSVKPESDLVDGRPAWQQEAWRFITRDNCRGAIAYLDQHHFTDPMWYVMRSQANLLCWQERLGDTYKSAAFADLESGLRANPGSPRLLKEKAESYAATGDPVGAENFFHLAAESARQKLAKDASNPEADEVLHELAMTGHGN